MSAAEFAFWIEYRGRHGLPAERAEIIAAISAAANCQVHGAKAKAADFIPNFGEGSNSQRDSVQQLKTFFGGCKRATTRRITTEEWNERRARSEARERENLKGRPIRRLR
jgi:hypothetical protein